MKNAIIKLFLLFLSLNIYSQDRCDNLIKQGIREYTKSKTYTNSFSLTKQKVKEIYDEYKKDNSTANASAKLKAVFKGKAKYSREEIESLYKLYWNENLDVSRIIKGDSFESTHIDENFVRLYEACLKSQKNNISLTINSSDSKLNSLTIKAEAIIKSGQRIPKVTSIVYDSLKLKVSGGLLEAAKKKKRISEVLTLMAERTDINPRDSVWFNNRYVLAKPIQMIINFNTYSNTINFPVVELPKKRNVLKKGVGEIVASILDEEIFTSLYGTDWVLANGDPAPENSAYLKYIRTSMRHMKGRLPDLRGVFLRGYNNDTLINPDNSKIGQFQEDAIRDIKGSFLGSNPNQTSSGVFVTKAHPHGDHNNWGNQPGSQIFFDISRVVKTSKENRPKNVTVNYFIKIN